MPSPLVGLGFRGKLVDVEIHSYMTTTIWEGVAFIGKEKRKDKGNYLKEKCKVLKEHNKKM